MAETTATATAAATKRVGVDSDQSLIEAWSTIVQKAGRAPDFVGRYISGPYAITSAEINFYLKQRAAIALFYNELTEDNVKGSAADGQYHGQAALRGLNALGAPRNVRPIFDFEAGWYPTADFVWGIWQACPHAVFYCNPYDPGFQSAMETALGKTSNISMASTIALWSAEPECGERPLTEAPWNPATCWSLRAVGQQWAENAYGGLVDLDSSLGFDGFWEPSSAGYFFDVPDSDIAAASIGRLARTGIVQGEGANLFGPDQPVTRRDMALLLDRIALREGWYSQNV